MAASGGGELVPAIGYVRVSMAREEMVSPQIQRSVVSGWAKRSGRRIIDWVEDLDETGRNFRRKVMKVIARLEAGEAHEIVVYRYDRWGRNAQDSLDNIKRVENAGGSVVSATEPMDPATAIGRYSRTNALGLAELQSDIIGENWAAAIKLRVEKQLPGHGTPRFGYIRRGRIPDPDRPRHWRRDPDHQGDERYEADPVTGPVLAEMYERYAAGQSANVILRWLNGTGARTTRGNTWSAQSLFNILDSGFAAGLLRLHDPACRCKKSIHRCHRVLYVPGSQEPVIGPETWEAVKERRARGRSMAPRLLVAAYPLSGLARCGGCGLTLTPTHKNGITGYGYRCRSNTEHRGCPGVWIARHLVEEHVRAEVARWAADIETAAAVTRARERTAGRAQADTVRLAAELARTDRALVRLVTQRADDDGVPDEVYEKARKEHLERRAGLTAAITEASQSQAQNTGEFLPLLRDITRNWEMLPPSRLRDMLSEVVKVVFVHRTGIRTPARIQVVPVWETEE